MAGRSFNNYGRGGGGGGDFGGGGGGFNNTQYGDGGGYGGAGGGGYGDNAGYGFTGGGGFLADGQNDNSMTQAGGDKKGAGRSPEVVPVTIAEIRQNMTGSTDDRMRIGNVEVHRVVVVGQVKRITHSATAVTYELDDKTGQTIEAKMWLDSPEDLQNQLSTVEVSKYVRVFGSLKTFQNTVNVVAFAIIEIQDMNEISMHILEVVHSHAVLRKMSGESGGSAGANQATKYHNSTTVVGGVQSMGGGDDYNNGYGANIPQGFNACQAAVFQHILQNSADEQNDGTDVNELVNLMARQFPKHEILGAVDLLNQEGHIFSTITDHHFKAMGSN
ncbi:hypothetical protein RvY_00174 [Ramazzottius varieornatus]|uniref:Replication protein A C-terminal domain-containing protein n=1 Tax=Ramazzottius varieornatus TaxID=947166 RepID=A0A1D1UCA3_RAMVA|nr:hypothetical protein RvY_00174 [Ramazzottius varieornatus]